MSLGPPLRYNRRTRRTYVGKRPRNYGKDAFAVARAYRSRKRKKATETGYQSNWRRGGLISVKNKFFDQDFTDIALTTTWVDLTANCLANCINSPAQGNSALTRQGDQIEITSIHVRILLTHDIVPNSADPPVPTCVRLVLVCDKQVNNNVITATDVMDPNVGADFMQFRDLSDTGRYVILKDKKYILNPSVAFTDGTNTGSVSGTGKWIEWNIPAQIRTDFSASTGDVADIVHNAIYLLGVASQNSTSGVANFSSRIRFKDG